MTQQNDARTTQTREMLDSMTPADARQRLEEGNRRFVSGNRASRDLLQQVSDTSTGQAPFAAVLGCIDSRAAAEFVFDLGIGDIFDVRVAGNSLNDDILGSLEFAGKVVGSKLIVVLGHSRCGAVMGACDGVEMGHLTGLLSRVKPAIDAVERPSDPAERTSRNPEFVQDVARHHVEMTVAAIRAESEILRELENSGAIAIAGAMYDVHTGVVEWLS